MTLHLALLVRLGSMGHQRVPKVHMHVWVLVRFLNVIRTVGGCGFFCRWCYGVPTLCNGVGVGVRVGGELGL